MNAALAQQVRRRARHCCEYCQMPQEFYPTVPFPIDHILAKQHGGKIELSNLALACLHCNSHKGPNIAGIDPLTKRLTRLFDPRRQKWERHFRWNGPLLEGLTKEGRATVVVLALNHPDLIEVRAELLSEGSFPPNG
jgi:hypothetical protein